MTEATPLASEQITQAGQFLLDRLVDHEVRMTSDEDAREWHGHVTPAMARFRAALAASPAPSGQGVSGEVWQHVKRGTRYAVIGTATLQATGPLHDYAQVVVYRGDDGALWARKESEFRDGRFVRLAAPAPSCAPGEVERLTQALRDVVNPLGYLQRKAEAEGNKLGGMAYTIANDISTVQRIASEALAALSPQGLDAKEGGE